MRRLMALAFLACLGLAPAASAGALAGVVLAIKGEPSLKRAGTAAVKPLKLKEYVNEGDSIITKAGDFASVAFVGGAEVRVSELSTFVIEKGGGQEPTQLFTTIGKAWTRLLHGHSGINIRTPTAVAAVRGTEADVESGEQTTVKVYEGFVDVYNDHGRQNLTAGQITRVSNAKAAPLAPRKMTPQEVQHWQDGIKGKNVEKSIDSLLQESDRRRDLQLKGKNGKPLTLHLEKK